MSLKTGILTLIGENGKETELKTVGKIFRIGSYLSCDLVLDNPEARNIHCEIQSDSFGRITITNHSKSNPVRINGVPLKATRPLYTGSVISIFEKTLKWVNKHRLPRNIVDMEKNQTPKIGFKRTDQAPNSEPSAPMRRKQAQKRLTMHNFGTSNHLVDEDDVDTFRDGNDENIRQDRLTRASIISAAKSFGATPPRSACRSKILNRKTFDTKFPDDDYACKENKVIDTPEMKKLTLLKCQSSAMVVTSYSPNATPKKTPSSFACVMSNKNTPKSAYGTPRSVFSELNTSECIKSSCSTPKTPTETCTMYLIDLTSPDVYKTPLQKRTPLFRSALKNSTAKSVSKVAIKDDPNSTIISCTPSSNKKLRWNTSDVVIKAEKVQTPAQITLNKSTPYRKSSITPNKLRQSLVCRSIGKKLHDCLSKSITETPPSLTRQRTLTACSAKSTHSISKVTPILKRKSLNTSLPLKTPKEIFSDGKFGTPKQSRLSLLRTPNSNKFVQNNEVSAKKPPARTSVSTLDRSKTFIVDSPSISQKNINRNIPNKTEEHIEEESAANDTFTCDDDSEMKLEDDSKKIPSRGTLNVSNMDLGKPILHEEKIQANSILSNENASILSNNSKGNLNASKASEDGVDFVQETPVEDEIESEEVISTEPDQKLNNLTSLSASNRTPNKSNESLNNTFDRTEPELSARKSLRRRSVKENETEENKSNVNDTFNFSKNLDSPREKKSEEKIRKSRRLTRYSTNIQLTPCRGQIQSTSETTTTPLDNSLPMNADIVSNKECLEKQLKLSLSKGKGLDRKEETSIEEESEAITEQENISFEDEEMFNNPSNMSISNSTFNKSNRSLNKTGENEAEISLRNSVRRQTLKEGQLEKSNVSSKFNISAKLDSPQEEKFGAKSRKSTRLSQKSANIESFSCQDSQQEETLGAKSHESMRISQISTNIETISCEDFPQKEKLEAQSRKSMRLSQTSKNIESISCQDLIQSNIKSIETSSPSSISTKALTSPFSVSGKCIEKQLKLSFNACENDVNFVLETPMKDISKSLNQTFDNVERSEKHETSRKKSLRRRSEKESEPVKDNAHTTDNASENGVNFMLERPVKDLSESISAKEKTFSEFHDVSIQSLNQTFDNAERSEKHETSRKKSLRRQSENEGDPEKDNAHATDNASENDVNFMLETPVKRLSESTSAKEKTFSEFHDVSIRSLNQTFDNAERSVKHDTSRKKSLMRRSEKEGEPEKDNAHAADKLTSTASHENKSDENRRKSSRLSRTRTEIESISPQDQIDESNRGIQCETVTTPLADSHSVVGNDDSNKPSTGLVHKSPKLFGIKEMLKTPKISKDIDFTGVKELVRGRKSTVGLRNVVGVKELFNTPKQGGLTNLVGVKELIKTPKAGQGLIDAKGMKELFNTPARDDLTDVFGVKELVNTPKPCTGLDDLKGMKELFNTPTRDDLTDVYGVKELVNTPKPNVGLTDLKGMKELFNTPTRDDLTDVFGVKELVNTPQIERGFEDPKGVKELFNTPARDDLTDVLGVKELVNTPKPEVGLEDGKGVKELFKTPSDNTGYVDTRGVKELFKTPTVEQGLDDGKGVKELFKTPRSTPGKRDARGIKELFNTPAQYNVSDVRGVKELVKTPIEKSPILTGMRELMRTPYVSSYEDNEGLSDVFKTPASRGVMVLSTPKSIAVEKLTSTGNLLKTPKELNVLEDIEEVEEIFKTPVSDLINSELQNDDSLNVSPEESFDKLVGKPYTRRTYGRKSVNPRILPIPIASGSAEDNAKTDIQEWVDNVVTLPKVGPELQTTEEIIINSPVVKLHRKPLATSSSIKPKNNRRSSRFTNALLKDGDLNEVSGIEQLDDSFLSSSEISGVLVENDERSKSIIVDTLTVSPEKRKKISSSRKDSITSKTPQKAVQFVDSSHHAIKVTPQIRRLRNRVSTPYTKKGLPPDSTTDPFADLSIQYIDESSPKISDSKEKSKNTSLYKIRRSGRTNDISLELIDSKESSTKRSTILNTINNSTIGADVEFISTQENSINCSSVVKTGRISRKTITESGCVISISDDEILNGTSRSKEGKSLLQSASKTPDSGPVEFVATNELSAVSDNNQIQSVDALQSINNTSENITLIDVGASIDDTKEASLDYVSENISGECSTSLVDSVSYKEEEEKLLNLYDTRLSDTASQTLEIVYVDSNSRTESTNVSADAGGINFDDELSSISIKSNRQSLRKSVISVNEESCVEKSMDGNTTQKSLNVKAIELSERNNSTQKTNALNQTTCSFSNLSVEQVPQNKSENMSNEFENFDDNLEVKQRFVGSSLTPNANKSKQTGKNTRKTMGSIGSSEPIDFEAEKMRLEFTHFTMNPKVMMTRATSQLELQTPRLTVSRRTTGKLPLNPYFNVEAERERRNLSIEFENFNANKVRRSFRGQSLSPLKRKNDIKKRRTVGQKPLIDESFDYEYELERRNMSLEFSQFEPVPLKRINLRSRSLISNVEKIDLEQSKNRLTMGQLSKNKFDYEAEVDRRNMSLEFENFKPDAQVALNSRRMTVGVNKAFVSKPYNRLSEGQNVTETNFNLLAEKERRKLSLDFQNFDENPLRKPRTRGQSEKFDSIGAGSSAKNNRKTLGEYPSSDDFNLEREVENYNLERAFENNQASHSQSPVKNTEMVDNNVEEAAGTKISNHQDIILNIVEVPEGKNESENEYTNDSSTKVTSKTSETVDVELEADAKARHVRFGENVYYEISLLESYDSNKSQIKNSRVAKKPKAAATKRTLEKEILAPRSRSRRNKTGYDDGYTEGISEHGVDHNALKPDDKNKENVTTRRGKRNRTIVQQTEEKLDEVNSLEMAEPSNHNDAEISDSNRVATEPPVPEEVATSLKSSSNEPLKPQRGRKATVKNRKEIQSESVDDTSKVEGYASNITVPEREIAVVESNVKDESEENNTKTRSRRGKQTGSNKRAKQKEDKINIKDENTIVVGPGSNDTDTNDAEHQNQEKQRVDTTQENVLNEESITKTRPRRLKTRVETETSVSEVANSNEGTLSGNVVVTANDTRIDTTPVTIDSKEIQEAETISKILDNPVEHEEIEKDGKDNMLEERNDNKPLRKMGRARKVAQINEEVRSSPRTRVRSNAEKTTTKKDEVKTVEIQQVNKTANDDKMDSSAKTPVIQADIKEFKSNENSVKKQRTRNTRQKPTAEISNSDGAPPTKRSQRIVSSDVENKKNSDEFTMDTSSSGLGVDQSEPIISESRRRNLRRKPLLETDGLNAETPADIVPAKRTRRLASNIESTASDSKTKGRTTRAKVDTEDKENIKIMPENITNDANAFKIPIEIMPKVDETPLRPEYSENDLKDPETPNSLSSTNMVPAKRTRRLASNTKATVDNAKPKGRAGRAKAKVEDEEDVNIIVEPAADEVLQSTGEGTRKNPDTKLIVESNTLVTNPSKGQVQESEPVATRRNRRLASVDIEPTERRPTNRTARTRGKKEENEDFQSIAANESKEHESIDEKTEREEIVFKTPNEVKPKRRGARLRSTTDTPTKDSAETASTVPARRTRRLVSVETVPQNTPEISARTSSDELVTSTEKNNGKLVAVESQEKESLLKLKPKRGRKVAAKTQPFTPEIEQNKDDNPEEMTTQPNEQPNDPEITPKESNSKTIKRGRLAKRKVESVEVNTDEAVSRTRSRRK